MAKLLKWIVERLKSGIRWLASKRPASGPDDRPDGGVLTFLLKWPKRPRGFQRARAEVCAKPMPIEAEDELVFAGENNFRRACGRSAKPQARPLPESALSTGQLAAKSSRQEESLRNQRPTSVRSTGLR